MGRPKLLDSRSGLVKARVSLEELRRVHAAADMAEMSVSDLVRVAVLGTVREIEIDQAAVNYCRCCGRPSESLICATCAENWGYK